MFMNRKCCCPTNPCVEPNVECCQMGPIMEKPIEKCVQKDIIHEVEHICPINTRVINHHIYKHVYIPHYSCCEEDVITNVDECPCNMSNY